MTTKTPNGSERPEKATSRSVRLCDIQIAEERFQHRNYEANGVRADLAAGRSQKHVETLAAAVSLEGKLDPVLLWQDAEGTLWLVDGHHRYRAYLRAWKSDKRRKIPARVLKAGIPERAAIRAAYLANRKDKLSMTSAEKSQAAWRLICSNDPYLEAMSLRGFAQWSGVSRETVRKMRIARDKLRKAEELEEHPLWHRVCRLNWDDQGDFDEDAWRARKVEQLTVDLEGTLRRFPGVEPEIWAEALQQAMANQLGSGCRVRINVDDDEGEPWDDEEEDY